MNAWLFLVYLAMAWIFYAIDRSWGKGLYRAWYDFTHENALPVDTIRGFVCGRSGKIQVKVAFALSILTTIGMAFFVQHGAIAWFFTWLLGFCTTIVGFILGPIVSKLWAKREKVYEVVEKVEAGQAPDEVKELKDKMVAKLSHFWPEEKKPEQPTMSPVQETPRGEKEMTPQEMIGQFTGGGNGDSHEKL